MQATMELVSRGEYVSWKLPKYTSIILSSNPDNGEYSVSSLDEAQRTRYVSFSMEFDVTLWAKWAEAAGIRGELINFALLYPELFGMDKHGQKLHKDINARSYTMFASAVNGLDFGTMENLELTKLISEGSFNGDKTVGNMFITFVHNKLDKLITPQRMIEGKWEDVRKELKSNVNAGGNFRADISATLTMRLVNYIDAFAFAPGAPKDMSEKVCNRILEIVKDEETLLTEDLIYSLVKQLNAKHGTRVMKLIMDPVIRKKVL